MELNAEWEDMLEEPKEYWYIAELCGGLQRKQDTDNGEDRFNKQIGNYFLSREEAEKAVEKLKAWARLKKHGFKFKTWYGSSKNIDYEITSLENEIYMPLQICDDLDLLFYMEENE